MKKLIPLLLVVFCVTGIWLYSTSRKSSSVPVASLSTPKTSSGTQSSSPELSTGVSASSTNRDMASLDQNAKTNPNPSLEDGDPIPEVKPAAEVFTSAEDALAAVLKAAKDYDDSVLEQFTQPGNDCTWCPDFYRSVKNLIQSEDTPQDQKSYLAEVMAISGRVENVQALVEAIKSAKSTEQADVFSEALELSVGKDDVTKYLGDQMSTTNETLREASVAAVTNQGTRLAAELLIKHTLERGDPDGYYSLGIGLGEFIPDEDAVPVLQQMVQKNDQYSHLAVKALINSGMDGLRTVFDELESIKDPEAVRKILKNDAIDHVNYEDGVDAYLKQKIASTKQPALAEFGKRILDEFSQTGDASSADAAEPAPE